MNGAASGPELILHHYANSPFSEKVRLILGYKRLAWRGVTVPSIMPKPDVVALTGGYRRTPFMQVGADIYCDTALICEELELRAPQPSLYPAAVRGMARVLAQWADSTLFWSAMAYNLQPRGAAHLFADAPPEAARAFVADRTAMRQGMARQHPGDATAAYRSYLRRLSTMLESQPFLLGSTPTVADFAAYHPLWFTRTRVPVLADVFGSTPSVLAWMDRMAAIGHGTHSEMSSADAIAVAAGSKPALLVDTTFQDEHGIALGEPVIITAESFGLEPTAGTLVAATRTRYIISRTDARAGAVHVHFPRIGFSLKKADAS